MNVIFYDGDCAFCNFWVKTAIRYDRGKKLQFAPLKSPMAIRHLGTDIQNDSVIFLKGKQVFHSSTAALRIAQQLDGIWPLLGIFLLIPAPLRDALYKWVARSRWLFGKSTSCLLPDPELLARLNAIEQ